MIQGSFPAKFANMFHQLLLVLALFDVLGAVAQLSGRMVRLRECTMDRVHNYYSTCQPTKSGTFPSTHCMARFRELATALLDMPVPDINDSLRQRLCAQCYSFGGSGFKNCCNKPTPYLCFQTAAGVGVAITTSAPPAITDAHQIACQPALSIIQSCSSALPNFDNLDDKDAASCVCYSQSSWQPRPLISHGALAIAWASTADITDYPDWPARPASVQVLGMWRTALQLCQQLPLRRLQHQLRRVVLRCSNAWASLSR